jgi:hypothetical protein
MKLIDFINKLQELAKTGIPAIDNAEFSETEFRTPYLLYLKPSEDTLWADGKPVILRYKITLELYTERDDFKSDNILKKWLIENKLPFKMLDKPAWSTEDQLYVTAYEVVLNG